ncbi:prepilin-type N-terminal cleavage/methylation domain-containing protein [Gracilibacillus sp. YIM 98692]|uniref:type IV pilus modification PilV family protein n=1 Tax=Gracilibacillus sp. YIM 98692 TaxID=2663532 RepID=UPI0013D4BCB3|nr:prepilin-type N-terminal cleavage/methylation domain-containing protein [Gracilibacillus sp. YIM 98692]
MIQKANYFHDQKGFTLVEVLVSVTILSMITVSFFAVFAFVSKTNLKSEHSIEAQYIGQDQIESIYQYSQTMTYEEMWSELEKQGFILVEQQENARIYQIQKDSYRIQVTFSDSIIDSKIKKILLKVFRIGQSEHLVSQLETAYKWR